ADDQVEVARRVREGDLDLVILPPHGLGFEPGSVPGTLTLRLREPASRDLVFAAEAIPAGGIEWEGSGEIRIASGQRWGALSFRGFRSEEALLRLTLQTAEGVSAGVATETSVQVQSVTAHAETRLRLSSPNRSWEPGRGGLLTVFIGDEPTPLTLSRRGFAGWEEEATVVTLHADDPEGLLAALPEEVLIPAGEEQVTLHLAMEPREGTTRLRFLHGTQSLELEVRSLRAAWSPVGLLRIPLGSIAPVPLRLTAPSSRQRLVQMELPAGSAAEACVEDAESGGPSEFRRGESAWFRRIEAVRLGRSDLTFRSEGLDPLVVPIEVIPARIECVDGVLRLLDLPEVDPVWCVSGRRGSAIPLRLGAPRGRGCPHHHGCGHRSPHRCHRWGGTPSPRRGDPGLLRRSARGGRAPQRLRVHLRMRARPGAGLLPDPDTVGFSADSSVRADPSWGPPATRRRLRRRDRGKSGGSKGEVMQRVNRVRLDRSLAMLCLLAVLWTPVRVCRAEEEPARLLLRVTAEGKEIEGDCVQAALLDPATGESYASFRGLRYTGERAPPQGMRCASMCMAMTLPSTPWGR
ncbi:MAG: hypothetical protein HC813_01510, partial [Planctomycetes bacterium]|nr:hypothetical protein [Planctomycetota bacterium]